MPERKRLFLAYAVLVAATSALFLRVLSFYFVTFDDATLVYRNTLLVNLSWHSFFELWRRPFAHLYIPVGQSVWAFAAWIAHQCQLSLETAPFIFHSLNFIFHIFNVLLVFGLLKQLKVRLWGAVAGALIFALHPLQVESVAWVSAFRQVLGVFFSLLAVHCYFFMKRGYARFALFLLAFSFSILSQPTTVALPIMIPLIAWVFHREERDKWPLGLALMIGLVAFLLTKQQQPTAEIAGVVSSWQRPIIMLDAFFFYLTRIFVPFGLSSIYGRTPEVALGSSFYLFGLVSSLLFVVMFYRSQWRVLMAFAVVWFFISVLPTSGLVPFFFQKYSTVGDRYTYFGIVGMAIAFGAWAQNIQSRAGKIGVVILLLLLFGRSQDQLRHWRDDTAVVAQVAKVVPSADHRFNLAQMIVLEMEGQPPVAGLAPRVLSSPRDMNEKKIWLKVAELNCREAVRMRWEFPEAWALLGTTHLAQGRYTEAVAAFQIALQQEPKFKGAAQNLAMTYQLLGRQDLAENLQLSDLL